VLYLIQKVKERGKHNVQEIIQQKEPRGSKDLQSKVQRWRRHRRRHHHKHTIQQLHDGAGHGRRRSTEYHRDVKSVERHSFFYCNQYDTKIKLLISKRSKSCVKRERQKAHTERGTHKERERERHKEREAHTQREKHTHSHTEREDKERGKAHTHTHKEREDKERGKAHTHTQRTYKERIHTHRERSSTHRERSSTRQENILTERDQPRERGNVCGKGKGNVY